jgi:hypothetical protein
MALALSALFPAATAAQDHPTPPAEVVKQLRRHHHRGDWWRITTDSTRYEVRVKQIDAEGLAGLTTRRKAPPAPERIAWGSIERIDLRKSHERRGQITWMILGLSAGFIPLANGHANSSQPKYYMLGGAALGAYLGGKLGAQNVHERALYIAPTSFLPPNVPVVAAHETAPPETASVTLPSGTPIAASHDSAPTDSAAIKTQATTTPSADSGDAVSPRATSPPATASAAIRRARRRLSTHDLLRITGDFGTFHGYAASIGPEGLGGLRVETSYPSVSLPGLLRWDRIDRLEVRGSNAQRGAMSGAIGLGAATGFLGIPVGALASDNSDASMWGVVAACAGVGAGVGLLLGAVIGATGSSWHVVYQR